MGGVGGVGGLESSQVHGSGEFSGQGGGATDIETEGGKNNSQPSGEVGLDLSATPPPPVSPRTLSLQKSSGSSITSGSNSSNSSTSGIGSPFLSSTSRASSQSSSQYPSPRNGQVATVHLSPQAMQGMHENSRNSTHGGQGGSRGRQVPNVVNSAPAQPRGGAGQGGGQAPYINGSRQHLGSPVQPTPPPPSLPSLLTPSGSTNSLPGAASSNRLKAVDSFADIMGSISDEVRTR